MIFPDRDAVFVFGGIIGGLDLLFDFSQDVLIFVIHTFESFSHTIESFSIPRGKKGEKHLENVI